MTVASDLKTLGWRDGSAQSVRDFQRAWNLGPRLSADGIPGDKTQAALAVSMDRRKRGLPDISAHFSARELACECGGRYDDCRRIWTPAVVIGGLEVLRSKFGPFSPDRAGRCPRQNANVGGAPKSLHLSGYAVDIPVFKFTLSQMRSLGLWSGIGFYDYGPEYCRHVDMRHLVGHSSTPSRPALWEYPGADKHIPRSLNPGGALSPVVVPTAPTTVSSIPRNAFLTEDGIADLGTRLAFGRMWGLSKPSGSWDDPTYVKALQRWVGVNDDGQLGTITVKAVQKKVGVPVTGVWNYRWSTKFDNTTMGMEKYFNRAVRNRNAPI